MKKRSSVSVCLLLALLAVLAGGSALAAQEEEQNRRAWEMFQIKADAVVAKLVTFIPAPVPGLVDSIAGEAALGLTTNHACGEGGECGIYAPYFAGRGWYFDDPALTAQYEAAQKEGDALLERQKKFQETSEGAEALEASQKSVDTLGNAQDKYSAEMEKLVEQMSNPNLTEKDRQRLGAQMQELQKKMQQAQQGQQAKQAQSPLAAFGEEAKKLDKRTGDLKARVRMLHFGIEGNVAPDWCSGSPVRSGTLKGYPLYRYTGKDDVCLAIFLGPAGFKNPPAPAIYVLRPELKTIQVKAECRTTPQSAKADEAILRQLLEKVDYDGLAKMLQP